MRIVFAASQMKVQPWLDGLRAEFPDAGIEEWQPGVAPADYAVVWRPPQALFDEQRGLKAIFNTGAGVDALLALNCRRKRCWCESVTAAWPCRWPST